jgi:LmbE family N-acetylglucosaminyl deacetylase
MAPPAKGERILVVAPHPDDEALGCGGLIQQAVANGADVHVLLMTNGDASQFAVVFGEREAPWVPANMVSLGKRRQDESRSAMMELGLPRGHMHFLGFPNNGLVALWRPEHWLHSQLYSSPYTHVDHSPYAGGVTPNAPYCGEQVLADLLTVLRQVRPQRIFVTHPRDIHPDHWATNAFVGYAVATAAVRGEAWAKTVRLWGYLIHWPKFPTPRRSKTAFELLPPPELSGEAPRWYRLPLTVEQAKRKMKDVRTYASQEPRFDRLMLAFPRRDEIFEALPVTATAIGDTVRWRTPNAKRRGFGGVEVKSMGLRVGQDLTAQAEIETAPRKIPSNGYVCLDVRTWDKSSAPVITTLYMRAQGRSQAVRLEGETPAKRIPATVDERERGSLAVTRLTLPPGSMAGREVFVTCFGSINDRLTAPAVIGRVEFEGEGK